MDFSENIKAKSQDLIQKATTVVSIPIKWESPIRINCKDLDSLEDFKQRGILEAFGVNRNSPAIYYVEIVSKHSGKEIVDALYDFKRKKHRSCPKIDMKRDLESIYLYCGSRKEGLHGRFIQHLGFGSQNTYALQLFYWAKNLKLEINFHYAWLDPKYRDMTELVESALAQKVKPLVGKMA
jgi:hypothetical protein